MTISKRVDYFANSHNTKLWDPPSHKSQNGSSLWGVRWWRGDFFAQKKGGLHRGFLLVEHLHFRSLLPAGLIQKWWKTNFPPGKKTHYDWCHQEESKMFALCNKKSLKKTLQKNLSNEVKTFPWLTLSFLKIIIYWTIFVTSLKFALFSNRFILWILKV